MNNISLEGKVALITGAARGIGAELAKDFHGRGAKVLITDILIDEAKVLCDAAGDGMAFVKLDVSEEDEWISAFNHCEAQFGKANIVVNNAGVEVTSFITDCSLEAFRKIFDINVAGTFLGIKHGLKHMSRAHGGQGGVILNLSSMSHLINQPCFGPYGATKSAVDKLTKVAAIEAGVMGAEVRVNCLYPGIIQTDMQTKLSEELVDLGLFPDSESLTNYVLEKTPGGRIGTATDVANAAAYLCSDFADFINGVGLPVDAGMSIS